MLNLYKPFNISIIILGILSLFASLIIGKTSLIFSILIVLLIILIELIFNFRRITIPLHYLFFIISPVLLINYSSTFDFQIRIFTFIFIAYIISFTLYDFSNTNFYKINFKFSNISPFKIWIIAFLVFSVTSTFLFYKGVYLSGDEPDFLIISQSIVEDGDFELKNNYKDNSYYKIKPELRGSNWKITPHITMHNKHTRSFHMPGVSFMMVPFYALYNILDAPIHPALFFRYAMAFFNAFLALSIFILLQIYFKDKNIFSFWIILITSFPLLFHSITLFPEIPAALMSINIFIFGFTKYKNYFLTGLFLSLLPWFHVKYYPLVLVFIIAISFNLFNEWKITKNYKNIINFLLLPTLSLILLMIYCKLLYGTVSPTQIFPKQNYFLNPLLKIKVFFAYFFDQRDGLISYAPFLFLFFLGLKEKLKFKRLLFIAASSYILLHAFTTVRGAYAPAGRPLIFVIWIFILFLANFYFNNNGENNNWRKFFFKLLTGFTYFFTSWFFFYPFFMFQPVFSSTKNGASDILNYLGGDIVNLPSFFPSFLSNPENIHIPNFIWISILIIIIILFYSNKIKLNFISEKKILLQRSFAIILFFVSVFLLSYYPHVHLQKQNLFIIDKIPIYKTAKLFHYLEDVGTKKKGKLFRLKEGYSYDLYVNLNSWKNRKKTLSLNFKF